MRVVRLERLVLVISLVSGLGGVVVTTGCVSLGTHGDLQRQHAEVKERLADAQLDAAATDKQLDDATRRNQELEAQLTSEQARAGDLDAQRRNLEQQNEATQGDLAQVVKDRSALKGSVDEMKAALDELAKRKAEADRRLAEYKGLLARFKTLIDAGKLKVKIVDGRMVVALASDILFPSGSAALSKEGKESIAEVAKLLAQIPDRKFQVEGHTDNVPIKTAQFPSNWELASARAITVTRTMVEAGLPTDRVSAASFGDSKPAVANDTPEHKAQNRRIEIVVVPDLSSLPGFDELQRAGS